MQADEGQACSPLAATRLVVGATQAVLYEWHGVSIAVSGRVEQATGGLP